MDLFRTHMVESLLPGWAGWYAVATFQLIRGCCFTERVHGLSLLIVLHMDGWMDG